MTKRLIIISCIIVLGIGAAVAAESSRVTGSWRYKMTVEIQTPEGLKTGSAVREVHAWRDWSSEGAVGAAAVKGEAVVVDLGKRGKVFALLRNCYGSDYAYQVVFDGFPTSGPLTDQGIRYYANLKNSDAVTLPPSDYPDMIMFKNLKDPSTSVLLLSTEPYDVKGLRGLETKTKIKVNNFTEMFGRETFIKKITLKITNEPVTEIIKSYIPKFDNKPHLVYLNDLVVGN